MEYEIRKAKLEDCEKITSLYQEGIAYLKSCKVNQWQDGYPSFEVAVADVRAGACYLLLGDGQVLATMSVFPYDGGYDCIYEGEWLCGGGYLAVHRVCVKGEFRGKGLTKKLYDYVEKIAKAEGRQSLRADTHEDNISMQRALLKNGFTRRGIIYLERSREKRIAFEKKI